jgi:hypothetical protein
LFGSATFGTDKRDTYFLDPQLSWVHYSRTSQFSSKWLKLLRLKILTCFMRSKTSYLTT